MRVEVSKISVVRKIANFCMEVGVRKRHSTRIRWEIRSGKKKYIRKTRQLMKRVEEGKLDTSHAN